MCHTLIQYYIHCEHTNAAFIPCNSEKWYPSDGKDGLTMEWRDHSQLMSITHSYERSCAACLNQRQMNLDAEHAKVKVQALQGPATAVRSLGHGTGDDAEVVGDASNDTVVGAEESQEFASNPIADDNETASETLSERAFDNVGDPGSLAQQHRQHLPAQSVNYSPFSGVDDPNLDIDDLVDYLTMTIIPFPGLETSTIEVVDEVIERHLPPLDSVGYDIAADSVEHILPGIDMSGTSTGSASVRLIMTVVCDYKHVGQVVLQHMISELIKLFATTHLGVGQGGNMITTTPFRRPDGTTAMVQVLNARLVLEWSVLLLKQMSLAYDQLTDGDDSESTSDPLDICCELMELAAVKYKDIVQESRAAVWSAILNAVGMTSQEVTNIQRLTEVPVPIESDVLADRNHYLDPFLRRRPGSVHVLGGVEHERSSSEQTPETIVATAATMPTQHIDGSELGHDGGVNRGQPETFTYIMIGCNAPTHTKHKAQEFLIDMFLNSRYHRHPHEPYHGDTAVPSKRRLLIHFDACRHYNAIAVGDFQSVDNSTAASCGCHGFPDKFCSGKQASSLGLCLVCTRAKMLPECRTVEEAAENWEDTHFQRHVRLVTSNREVGLWPLSAEFDLEMSMAELRF